MSHKLFMHHMGPVEDCAIELKEYNVITGPQSQGKSTIAKAVYFFRSVKQLVADMMRMGGAEKVSEGKNAHWSSVVKKKLKDEYLSIFGTSWVLPDDMTMRYEYGSEKRYIEVSLTPDTNHDGRNFVNFTFSQDIEDYFCDLDSHCFTGIAPAQLKKEEAKLFSFFDDPFEVFYIPAGRSVITLLSDQLSYLFNSLDSLGSRKIDQLTKDYATQIFKLKPLLTNGLEGFLRDCQESDEYAAAYHQVKTAINLILDKAEIILRGKYRYVGDEERIYLPGSMQKYVKINFASSGQQEVVWVINLLLYFLATNKRVFLIVEEPESHLYPESQRLLTEVLSAFRNTTNLEGQKCTNHLLITTHSPYVLGSLNYMLMAGQCSSAAAEKVKKEINKRLWLRGSGLAAWFVTDGRVDCGLNEEDGLTLIRNELIDGASDEVNRLTDFVLEQELDDAETESE